MSRLWFSFTARRPHASDGVNDAWVLTSESIAKENGESSPYLIPNELVCGHIANFLRLPVPPFALMRNGYSRKGMFASLRFNRSNGDAFPDDVNWETLVGCRRRLCTGILLFDVLVANEDRHRGNIQVDRPHDPRVVRIFDHDRALFGCFANSGEARLRNLRDRLGISGGSLTGGNRHCLLDRMDSNEHFREWFDRIESIPDWFIDDVCGEVISLGARRSEADAAADFLKYRKRNLPGIVHNHRAEFTAIPANVWGLFT